MSIAEALRRHMRDARMPMNTTISRFLGRTAIYKMRLYNKILESISFHFDSHG